MWEVQPGNSPYHYAYNDPINGSDGSGMFTQTTVSRSSVLEGDPIPDMVEDGSWMVNFLGMPSSFIPSSFSFGGGFIGGTGRLVTPLSDPLTPGAAPYYEFNYAGSGLFGGNNGGHFAIEASYRGGGGGTGSFSYYFNSDGTLGFVSPSDENRVFVQSMASNYMDYYKEINYSAFREFISIVSGETFGRDIRESIGVGQVMLHRLGARGVGAGTMQSGFVSLIGGKNSFQSYNEGPYNSVMNGSQNTLFEVIWGGFGNRIQGAISSLSNKTSDVTGGAWFFGTVTGSTVSTWIRNGTMEETATYDRTIFARYSQNWKQKNNR